MRSRRIRSSFTLGLLGGLILAVGIVAGVERSQLPPLSEMSIAGAHSPSPAATPAPVASPRSAAIAAASPSPSSRPASSVIPRVSPSPTPAPTPSAAAEPLVITDSGQYDQSYSVTRGRLIDVVVGGDGQRYHGYVTPRSSNTSVVAPTGRACPAPSGSFCTQFVARSGGSAWIESSSDPPCLQSTPPCAAPSRDFRASFTVSG